MNDLRMTRAEYLRRRPRALALVLIVATVVFLIGFAIGFLLAP